jgi:hypothetical protein
MRGTTMPACEYVTMRSGLLIPADTLRRLWKIEERGVHFRLDDGDVVVGPRRLLADGDLAFITEQKKMIISILSMQVTM